MRRLFGAALFAMMTALAIAAPDSNSRFDQFQTLMKAKKYDEIEKQLAGWKKDAPDDPELAVAYANLWYTQSDKGSINMNSRPDGKLEKGDEFSLKDPKTGKTVGAIGFETAFDDALVTKAVTVLREATVKHPERLDIRFGAAHMLGQTGHYDEQLVLLRETLPYIAENSEKLTWMRNAKLPKPPAQFIPESLHSYALALYRSDEERGPDRLRELATLTAKYFPKHPIAFNDLAAYYSGKEDDKQALKWLLKAHEADPEDALVTLNIASAYGNMKQTEKAKEFLKKAKKLDPKGEYGEAADEKLKEMK